MKHWLLKKWLEKCLFQPHHRLWKIAHPLTHNRLIYFKNLFFCPPLKSVAIEINSACNRKCRWCPNYYNQRDTDYLDEDLFYKIIDELSGMRFKGKLFFNLFNEPLLDKRLPKFIEYAGKKLSCAHMELLTNGDLLNLPLWQRLQKAGLHYALITQYDGKINDNIQEILDKFGPEEKRGFYVRVFDVKNASNRAGAVNPGRKKNLPLNKICLRPFKQLCINYKGRALLCCNDYSESVELGDLHIESITQIWGNAGFKYYRKKLFFGKRKDIRLCKQCDFVKEHPY